MQVLDLKMIENHPCSKPLCVGYSILFQSVRNFKNRTLPEPAFIPEHDWEAYFFETV